VTYSRAVFIRLRPRCNNVPCKLNVIRPVRVNEFLIPWHFSKVNNSHAPSSLGNFGCQVVDVRHRRTHLLLRSFALRERNNPIYRFRLRAYISGAHHIRRGNRPLDGDGSGCTAFNQTFFRMSITHLLIGSPRRCDFLGAFHVSNLLPHLAPVLIVRLSELEN
jgi:hypothetical protein